MSANLGQKIFVRRCACCHTIEENGKQKIGPNLYGIYGNRSCTVDDYKYSADLVEKAYTWDEETLNKFLEDPKKAVPGTRMLFSGLKKPQEREDLLAFFKKQVQGSSDKGQAANC